MLLLRLAAYVLWIPGGFAIIAAVIMPVVGSGSRAAAGRRALAAGRLRAGRRAGPLHVHGISAATAGGVRCPEPSASGTGTGSCGGTWSPGSLHQR